MASCRFLIGYNIDCRMQQEQLHQERPKLEHPSEQQQQYTTYINQLISEPVADRFAGSAADYILSSIYHLSSYLFSKKLQPLSENSQQSINKSELSFDSYLRLMEDDLGRFQKIRTMKKYDQGQQFVNIEWELLRCYEKVEGIYFQQNYVFDLSYFTLFYNELKSKSHVGRGRVNDQIDKLCQCLDLVEINLFSQIHCKFEEYFKVVSNFQYLKESVTIHLTKLKESRTAMGKVRKEFLQKSVNLRRKIVQRQNIEKLIKLIKQIKSIKKLPQVLESILASSLPYESLSLLQDTKSIKESLKEVRCLKSTSDSVRNMEVLVQNDLTKRYANQLYLYLQECHSKETINLQQLWKQIETHTCLDKDSSFVLDQLNSSTNSALSDNPQIMEEIELLDNGNDQAIVNSTMIPRHEGREYQIAMILLQSYRYVAFTPQLTKIKVCNALRLFAKRFEKQLLSYLNNVVTNEIDNIKQKDRDSDNILQEKQEQPITTLERKASDQMDNPNSNVVEKVSVEFYIKHLGLLNQIFKETITRFLGYLSTLITEYEEEFINEWNNSNQTERSKLSQWHKKFKEIFQDECSLLPSIFKIIEQKIKYLLTLKNISSIDSLQFYRWITTLKYWQGFFNHLAQNHPLLNYQPQGTAQPYIQELTGVALENISKAMLAMNLQALLYQLTQDYVMVFHKNTTNNQIINTLQEDTWQSTEIPLQFSDILQAIFNPEGHVLNASVTILDSSTSSSKGALNSSRDRDNSRKEEPSLKTKIKLLKNNILISGVRYKVNLSFLIICESLGEYMKMARILSHIFQKDGNFYNKVFSLVYEKLYELIDVYCLKSKELILDTKALSFGKIKGKSINAKHICLLCNCFSVLQKIAQDMLDPEKVVSFGLNQKRNNTVSLLQSTRAQLISKLTGILNAKTEKEINDFLLQDKATSTNPQAPSKTSNAIITSFLQMVEITDEYLEVEGVKQVLRAAFQTLSQKYLTHLLLKGGKQRADVEVLIEKLKFLRKYFPTEYQSLLKQIPP